MSSSDDIRMPQAIPDKGDRAGDQDGTERTDGDEATTRPLRGGARLTCTFYDLG
jgi:hypothetical protein